MTHQWRFKWRQFARQTNRYLHVVNVSKLLFKEHGEPSKVLQQMNETLKFDLCPNEVLVKMIAAPINPQDVNIIEGKYPVRSILPSVPGNEGVGVIQEIGAQVTDLSIGDHVVPFKGHLGTWRSHFISTPNHLLKIPKKLGLVESATFTVNPCTAYRLLRDFAPLTPGDTLIQNGANSSCGQNVIQIARIMHIKTVNIVRDRVRIDDLKQHLTDLGANYIFTDEEIKNTNIFKSEVKKPRLGLNCVGGKSCMDIIRHLDKKSVLVTYGGMSRQPVIIPTGPLIFQKLKVVGFWLNDWLDCKDNSNARKRMYKDILELMASGELKGPCTEIIPFKEYKKAFSKPKKERKMIGHKYILKFSEEK